MACERARKTWRNSSYWVKPSPIGGGSLSLLFECKRKLGVAYRSSSNCTFALRSGLPMAFPTPLISTDRGRQTPWPVTPCAHPLHSYISLARGEVQSAVATIWPFGLACNSWLCSQRHFSNIFHFPNHPFWMKNEVATVLRGLQRLPLSFHSPEVSCVQMGGS